MMPTLRQLKAKFIAYCDAHEFHEIDDMGAADGIMFGCPKCYAANGDSMIGTHQVICNRPRVEQSELRVGPGRWEFAGSGLDDLTLFAGSSSIKLEGGCAAHFFVEHGSIRMA